jgi:hypothetical protein
MHCPNFLVDVRRELLVTNVLDIKAIPVGPTHREVGPTGIITTSRIRRKTSARLLYLRVHNLTNAFEYEYGATQPFGYFETWPRLLEVSSRNGTFSPLGFDAGR